ncbi:ethanolamine utilization protein-like protein [Xylariomycetidae sp. FL0641]|nr:ethanolamine utilization protein-like protein [Xylariomycetidae sp. FL0641]
MSSETTTGPVAMTYYSKASSVKPPLIANENAFLGDVSCSKDPEKPISAGFYRLEKGTPLVYEYKYHEMKIIIDGSFDISDEAGNKVHAVAGDVFYFPDGAKITFTTNDFGLAFYCGQRAQDTA